MTVADNSYIYIVEFQYTVGPHFTNAPNNERHITNSFKKLKKNCITNVSTPFNEQNGSTISPFSYLSKALCFHLSLCSESLEALE